MFIYFKSSIWITTSFFFYSGKANGCPRMTEFAGFGAFLQFLLFPLSSPHWRPMLQRADSLYTFLPLPDATEHTACQPCLPGTVGPEQHSSLGSQGNQPGQNPCPAGDFPPGDSSMGCRQDTWPVQSQSRQKEAGVIHLSLLVSGPPLPLRSRSVCAPVSPPLPPLRPRGRGCRCGEWWAPEGGSLSGSHVLLCIQGRQAP